MKKSTVTLEQVLEETGITARAEAKGETKGKMEVVRNLVNMGVSPKKITLAAGMDIKTVKSLIQP